MLLALPAAATSVFVCEENGRKVFSQTPCSEKAQEIQIERPTRSVRIAPDMAPEDLAYFCSRVMQATEKAVQDRRQRYQSDGYGGYTSASNGEWQRHRNYVLSHVSNLQLLARDLPEVYGTVQELADWNFYGSSYGYGYDTSDASRTRGQRQCEERLGYVLQEAAALEAQRTRDYQRGFRR